MALLIPTIKSLPLPNAPAPYHASILLINGAAHSGLSSPAAHQALRHFEGMQNPGGPWNQSGLSILHKISLLVCFSCRALILCLWKVLMFMLYSKCSSHLQFQITTPKWKYQFQWMPLWPSNKSNYLKAKLNQNHASEAFNSLNLPQDFYCHF